MMMAMPPFASYVQPKRILMRISLVVMLEDLLFNMHVRRCTKAVALLYVTEAF